MVGTGTDGTSTGLGERSVCVALCVPATQLHIQQQAGLPALSARAELALVLRLCMQWLSTHYITMSTEFTCKVNMYFYTSPATKSSRAATAPFIWTTPIGPQPTRGELTAHALRHLRAAHQAGMTLS